MKKNRQRRGITPAQLGSLSTAIALAVLGLRLAHRSVPEQSRPQPHATSVLDTQPDLAAGAASTTLPGPPARQEERKPDKWVRTYNFTLKYPWFGPVVWILSTVYFFVQITVAWVWKPPYSVVDNTISDLGNTRCGLYGGSFVCSSRHVLMNVTFVALGAVMIIGSFLIAQEFRLRENRRERIAAQVAFGLMMVAGIGVAMVGFFPENTFGAAHGTGAAMAIGGGNLCILILGLTLPLPESFRRTMRVWPIVALTAAVLFASNRNLGLGDGTMERIAQYPESIWLITFGIYISHNHYSRSHARKADRPFVSDRESTRFPYKPSVVGDEIGLSSR